ncbi:hypothetical protein BGZ70_000239 [Mortierella alpina]|uniref:BTB domain-containing protein n=1 Tax=Mortierella alpina TaxID=64518 RepID=A0A9P6M643_MORAP|nr:hypothetical protein BGZ70_000239 [Mortierella alpina]
MTRAYHPQQQHHRTTAETEPSDADQSQYHQQPCHASSSDPPVHYMAYVIASRLLPMGAAMFNRRSDANCVLCVGDKRFYVHVQMLASRSPTFRRIFDEMIAHQAWGSESENPSLYLDQEDDVSEFSDSEDMDISNGQPEVMTQKDETIFDHCAQDAVMDTDMDGDLEGDEEGQQDNDSSSSHSSAVSECDMEVTWTKLGDPHSSLHSHTDPQLEDNYVSDGTLPELCIALDDPEGGHIDELLYWLYTDDGPRWKASFNKGDYESILKNIRHLDIVSPAVLTICKDFEASIAGRSVRGRAEKVLSPLSTLL